MIGPQFITAGNATFTIQGKASRFTFKVTRKDPEPDSRYTQPTFFVGLLTGPDNTANYSYVGLLDPTIGHVRLTRNSRVSESAPSLVALRWTLQNLWAGKQMPPSFGIFHEGRCGRCGRALTVPSSIATGLGPDCAEQMGVPMVETQQAVAAKREDDLFAVAFEA